MESIQPTSLWVFGYGSLCWHPGFHHGASKIGHIKNYIRRFWQGNTTHRGVPNKPGRVATLITEKNGTTWGVAYEMTGEAALIYLNQREVSLGGYTTDIVNFYPRSSTGQPEEPFPVLVYIATAESHEWAGPAPLHEIATQIMQSSGPSGHNVEYLIRLAEFMREKVPEAYDDHLYTLETIVRIRIKETNMCMKSLMGESSPAGEPAALEGAVGVQAQQQDPQAVEERRDTFQYSAKISPKKLRCLNV